MADLKRKGDLAELMVAADLLRQGHRVAFPFGEDWEADLIVERSGSLERVQVKHKRSDGRALEVKCYSTTITQGRPVAIKRYTAATIDWLAAWDATTGVCVYVPAAELGPGRNTITLRYDAARNGQRQGIRMVEDYRTMEPAGIEPATS